MSQDSQIQTNSKPVSGVYGIFSRSVDVQNSRVTSCEYIKKE